MTRLFSTHVPVQHFGRRGAPALALAAPVSASRALVLVPDAVPSRRAPARPAAGDDARFFLMSLAGAFVFFASYLA